MFTYQNGRAYRMDLGQAWRQMSRPDRDTLIASLTNLATIVRSDTADVEVKRGALSDMRASLGSHIVEVTTFQRSGVNAAAGRVGSIMPVNLSTREGAVELIPNRKPPRLLGDDADISAESRGTR